MPPLCPRVRRKKAMKSSIYLQIERGKSVRVKVAKLGILILNLLIGLRLFYFVFNL